MNGVFNTGMTFSEFIGAIIVLVLGVIAVRVSLTFDINKFLERRDKKLSQRLKNTCTHLEMLPTEDGQFQIRSLFESPPGTLKWQCQRCGLIANHDNDFESRAEYYSKNPEKYLAKYKEFHKLLKKSGIG